MKPFKSPRIAVFLLILLAATITYWNHFDNSFQFDDAHTIEENLWIRDLKNIPRFFTDATTTSTLPYNQAYRPGVTTLNAIDYALGDTVEPEPFPFHRSIFIAFLLLGFGVYYFFYVVLGNTGITRYRDSLSLFGMAWFLLHTANAETINYIIARSDTYSTLFVVMGFAFYFRFPTLRKYHLYALPALLGFLVKEPALMFFPLLLAYQLLFEQKLSVFEWFRQFGKTWRTFRAMWIPLVAAIGLFALSRHYTPDIWQPGGSSPFRYLMTQPFVIFHYVYNFILPLNLVVDTDWTLIPSYRDDRLAAGLLFIGALFYIILRCSRHASTRPISFGILWFFIALIPSSSLMPFAEVLNDHRTFFPYIGLFLAVLTAVQILLQRITPTRVRWVGGFGLLLLVAHAWGTYQRNEVWHSEESLWKEATVKAPLNTRSWLNYGNVLLGQARYPEALACFEESVRLSPGYTYAYINRGIARAQLNDAPGAETDFKMALQIDSLLPESYAYYARHLLTIKRPEFACPLIEKGLSLSPRHQLLNQLRVLCDQANPTTAVETGEQTVRTPQTPEAYLELSLQHYQATRYADCIRAAEEALRLKPDYDLAYNNLCAAYNRLGQWDKAIEAGEKGLRINPNYQLLKNNLAESYSNRK